MIAVVQSDLDRKRRKFVVRWILLFASIGWGISIWFALVPWDLAMAGLVEMGAGKMSYDPFLNYWMRVIALIFSLIGAGCFWVALRLDRYVVLVPPLGWFHLMIGVGTGGIAFQLGMNPQYHPTLVAEVVFSLTIGAALLLYGDKPAD